MSETHGKPALASHRDTVAELIREGPPLHDVEDAIDAQMELTEDQKAALWLFAFSLRERSEQKRDVWADLAAVHVAAGDDELTAQAREHMLGAASEAALSEQAGAERYQRYQREVRSGRARATDHARPREFDARGFPIPQRNRSFLERVARLLNPYATPSRNRQRCGRRQCAYGFDRGLRGRSRRAPLALRPAPF